MTNLSNSLISGRASADESICPVRGATKGARASNASSAHLKRIIFFSFHIERK